MLIYDAIHHILNYDLFHNLNRIFNECLSRTRKGVPAEVQATEPESQAFSSGKLQME